MSFTDIIPTGVSIATAAIESLVPPVLFRSRLIGPFVPQVTVEEEHIDELAVTEQPVEQGAAITDHSYKRPARLTVTAGWSNSNNSGNALQVEEIYAGFLALQATRQPFVVITGKRFYKNMLITRLFTRTNKDYENSMILVCEMQEVILVSTQTVTVPPAANMKTPEVNAATVSTGTKALQPGTGLNASALPQGITAITVDTPNPNAN
jgi:hypothetical protein